MRTLLVSLSAVLAFGCASPKDAESPDDHAHGDKHDHGDHGDKHGDHGDKHDHHGGEKHHKKLADGPVKDFHDVMAPVFHMEKGAARVEKTCAAVPAMKDKAAALVSAAAADGKADAAALSTSVGDLETACGGDKTTVEAKLETAHDAFHKVMDATKH